MAAQNKTQSTESSVNDFLTAHTAGQQRADSEVLIELMSRISGHPATMWGPSIIGFDTYHYRYASGREGDTGALGFSPRKSALVIYLVDEVAKYSAELAKLGKHTTGKGCLYIKRLSDINVDILGSILRQSYVYAKSQDTEG